MRDVTADVIVVGYGAAGVCAALEARARGADVLAIDRFNGGGATQVSGGIIYAGGGTWVQREAGVDDTADACTPTCTPRSATRYGQKRCGASLTAVLR